MSRPTFGERWREYGERPPIARRVARASSLVGLVIGIIALLLIGVPLVLLCAWLGLLAWRALFG